MPAGLVALDGDEDDDGDDTADEGMLFGSAEAVGNPCLEQGRMRAFETDTRVGYWCVGFWGHGVNSYAFYYSRVTERSRVLFRLPYGGVYMDDERGGAEIGVFLPAFLDFEASIADSIESMVAIDSMWEGHYRLTFLDGRVFDRQVSLLGHPDFASLMTAPPGDKSPGSRPAATSQRPRGSSKARH